MSKWSTPRQVDGLPKDAAFICKSGIDGQTALKHLRSIMRSWEPKHEHKESAVAWLMCLWFEDITSDGISLVTGKPVSA